MIRLILTSWILSAIFVTSVAQTDTGLRKSSDTLAVDTLLTDTLQKKKYDSVVTTYSATPQQGRSDEVYKLNLAVDIPLTAVAAGWSLYAFPKIYDKRGITEAELLNLRKENINGFDRWAADVYHDD